VDHWRNHLRDHSRARVSCSRRPVAGSTHRRFPYREDRPQGGGYSAFGAKEGGEDDVKRQSIFAALPPQIALRTNAIPPRDQYLAPFSLCSLVSLCLLSTLPLASISTPISLPFF